MTPRTGGGGYIVEKTESFVQCECPENLCTHADNNWYRRVDEWMVWDTRNDKLIGLFATRREAKAEADRGQTSALSAQK